MVNHYHWVGILIIQNGLITFDYPKWLIIMLSQQSNFSGWDSDYPKWIITFDYPKWLITIPPLQSHFLGQESDYQK